MQDLPFDTLKPKTYHNSLFPMYAISHNNNIKSEFQPGTFHVQAPTGTLEISCYYTNTPPHSILKTLEYIMTCPYLLLPYRSPKGVCRAGLSPLSCSRRPHGKEMHQVMYLICILCCSYMLLENSSKNCLQSVASAQIDSSM